MAERRQYKTDAALRLDLADDRREAEAREARGLEIAGTAKRSTEAQPQTGMKTKREPRRPGATQPQPK